MTKHPAPINFSTAQNIKRVGLMRKLLTKEPLSVALLAERMGVAREVANRLLRGLPDECHISGHAHNGTRTVPIWSWGPGENDVLPPRQERVNAQRRAVRGQVAASTSKPFTSRLKPQRVRRDASVAMLFGPAGASA